jgi:hypothetical protein
MRPNQSPIAAVAARRKPSASPKISAGEAWRSVGSDRSRSKMSDTAVTPKRRPPTSAYSTGSLSITSVMPMAWTSAASSSRLMWWLRKAA